MAIKWRTTKASSLLIHRIVERAVAEKLIRGSKLVKTNLEMDITAVHLNDMQLRLRDLVVAPTSDFGHDVLGIRRYVDRTTGKLTDCFVPRYARHA
jgi:hypothetical protein